MKKLLSIILLFITTLISAQGNLIPPVSIDSTNGSTVPDMVVYDRLGNSYYLNQLRFQNSNNSKTSSISPTCNAGIFRLHFTDAGTGLGFDDPTLGPQRQSVACQVFSDLSQLIIPANSPYSSIPNLGTGSFVEIWVQASLNNSANPTLGQAGEFYLTSSPGIVHGSVWQTINTGIDSWFGVNSTNLGNMGIYHGLMQINFGHPFYLGTNPSLITSTDFDLYTVILHEATHALGFGSLIAQNGTSKFSASNPGIYSYYDTFLKDNTTGQNLINWNGCYTAGFNNSYLSDLTTPCSVKFSGTNTTFVSSSSTWANGTSLSHYDIGACGNPGSYVMNPSLSPGTTRRTFDIAEVTTLCDLGYTTSGTLAGTTYPASGVCGFRVAGTNDYATYTSTAPGTNFSTPFNTPFNFSSTTILANDQNATYYDCLTVMNSSGFITGASSGGTGNTLTFTPNTGFQGVAILKYIPRASSTGKQGNITYIFIFVNPPALPPCNAGSCEMICYGGLEEFTSQLQYDLYTQGSFSAGASNSFNFVTVYPDNSPDFRNYTMSFPMYSSCPGTFSPISAHTGIAYVGLILRTNSAGNNPEGPSLPLNTPLNPGETATISMWARLNNSTCDGGVQVRFTNNQPCGSGTFLGSCPGLIQSPVLSSASLTSPSNVWQQITLTYFNNTTTTFNYLIINSLPFTTLSSPIFIDDISCIKNTPNLSVTKTGPSTACTGDIVPYTITVCNNSSFTASNVNITDNLPTGMSLASGGNFTYPTQNIPTLAAGACVNFTLNGQITATFGNLVNSVNVSSGGCLANTSANSTTLNITSQSLNVITTPSSSNPCSGSVINVSVNVCNYSSNPINNISIQTQLPAGYAASSGSGYTISGQNINFNLFNLLGGTATSPACTTLVVPVTVGAANGAICSNVLAGGTTCISNQSSGCSNITISPCNACSDCANILSGTITTSPPNGLSYCINSDIVIQGNINFLGSEFKFAPGVKVIVDNNAVLSISRSHLYACNKFWQGIVIKDNITGGPGTGRVIINGNSLVEDARIAVDVPNHLTTALPAGQYIVLINGAVLNKDSIGVRINKYQPAVSTPYLFSIRNSVFTCRNIPYTTTAPFLTSAGSVGNVKATAANVGVPLASPYISNASYPAVNAWYGMPSFYGLQLLNVGQTQNPTAVTPNYFEIQIGESVANTFNVFDHLITCIDANSSNFTCINNVFQNSATYGKGGSAGGIAIKAISIEKFNNRLQTINGASDGSLNNKFYNCSRSIFSQNYYEHNIQYCDVRSTQVNSAPITFLNQAGKYGFYMTTNRFRKVTVNNNSLYNIENAVVFNANYGALNIPPSFSSSNAQYSGQIDVNNNTIQPNIGTTPITTQYVSNAIYIANVNPTGNLNLVPNTTVNTYNNSIASVYRGIYVSNWIKKDVRTISNCISLKNDPYLGTPAQWGVNHSNNIAANSYANLIYNNDITGTGITNTNMKGAYSSMSMSEYMRCNNVKNTYSGIEFNGVPSNPGTLIGNIMQNHKYGFVLNNNAAIGNIGSPSQPADNKWMGTWSVPNYKTATLGGSSAQTSPMYVRSGPLTNPNLSGFTNGPSPLTDFYGTSNGSIIPATGPYYLCPSIGACIPPNGGNNGGNIPSIVLQTITSTDIQLMEKIALDQISYTVNPNESKFIGKNHLYRALRADNTLMATSPVLQNFYTTSQTTVRETLATIDDKLSDGNLSASQSDVVALMPQNNIEANYKIFYSSYLNYLNDTLSSTDSTNILTLANGCPTVDGAIVYNARALYNSIYSVIEQFTDNCTSSAQGSRLGNFSGVQKWDTDKKPFDAIMYPVPSSGDVNISPIGITEGNLKVIILDITGKVVFDTTLQITNGLSNFNLNLSPGSYLVKIINSNTNESINKKLIIQK